MSVSLCQDSPKHTPLSLTTPAMQTPYPKKKKEKKTQSCGSFHHHRSVVKPFLLCFFLTHTHQKLVFFSFFFFFSGTDPDSDVPPDAPLLIDDGAAGPVAVDTAPGAVRVVGDAAHSRMVVMVAAAAVVVVVVMVRACRQHLFLMVVVFLFGLGREAHFGQMVVERWYTQEMFRCEAK